MGKRGEGPEQQQQIDEISRNAPTVNIAKYAREVAKGKKQHHPLTSEYINARGFWLGDGHADDRDSCSGWVPGAVVDDSRSTTDQRQTGEGVRKVCR